MCYLCSNACCCVWIFNGFNGAFNLSGSINTLVTQLVDMINLSDSLLIFPALNHNWRRLKALEKPLGPPELQGNPSSRLHPASQWSFFHMNQLKCFILKHWTYKSTRGLGICPNTITCWGIIFSGPHTGLSCDLSHVTPLGLSLSELFPVHQTTDEGV